LNYETAGKCLKPPGYLVSPGAQLLDRCAVTKTFVRLSRVIDA